MKQTFKNNEQRLPGITALVVLLLQGAMAQEEITLPKRVFGTGPVNAATYSPDGKLIATANQAGTFLWDATTGARIRRFPGPMEGFSAVAFSPDGTRVATGSGQGRGLEGPTWSFVRVWDVETGTQIWEVIASPGGEQIPQIKFSPDRGTILSRHDGIPEYINLWDAATGQLRHTLSVDDEIGDADFSPDSTMVVAGCRDRLIRLWDVATGQELRTLRGHSGFVDSVAFSPDGSRILSGSTGFLGDMTVRLWDASSGALLQTLLPDYWGDLPEFMSVVFAADGEKVLTAESYPSEFLGTVLVLVRLWDLQTGTPELIWEYTSPFPWLNRATLCMTLDGTQALVALAFGGSPSERQWIVGLLDLANGGPISEIPVEHEPSWVMLSPDGSSIVALETLFPGTGMFASVPEAKLRNAASAEVIAELGFQRYVRALALSADGTKLAAATEGGTMIIWDLDSGREERRFDWPSHPELFSLDFSPDGSRLLVAGLWLYSDPANPAGRYGASVWNPATGEFLYYLGGPFDEIIDGEFSPNGQQVLLGGQRDNPVNWSRSPVLSLWDAETGAPVKSFTVPYAPSDVDFSEDGKRILACTGDVRMWDLASGALLRTFQLPQAGSSTACFSPDGSRVLAASPEAGGTGGAMVWNAETGEPLRTFLHDGQAHVARLSPDGKWVLTASEYDRRIWDTETGTHLYTLYAYVLQGLVLHADTFSSDATRLFGAANGAIAMWELVFAPKLAIARETDGRVVLTWQNPSETTAYVLQQCLDLASGQWASVSVTTPGRYEIAEPVGAAFYRLKQP